MVESGLGGDGREAREAEKNEDEMSSRICDERALRYTRSAPLRSIPYIIIHPPPYSSAAPQLPILLHEVAPSLAEQEIRLPSVVSEDRMALHGTP